MAEIARRLEVGEQAYHRWSYPFGGMQGEELEREGAQLKRVVAEQALGSRMLEGPRGGKLLGPALHGESAERRLDSR